MGRAGALKRSSPRSRSTRRHTYSRIQVPSLLFYMDVTKQMNAVQSDFLVVNPKKERKIQLVTGSVGDPEPEQKHADPHVFGPPGSGSISHPDPSLLS